jgi:two-component sensor histidine kinase
VIEHLHDHARVYRALQMPTTDRRIDAAAYLRELCQSISRARLRHKGIELLLIENPLHLGSVQCWKLGLIVAELITNASRHAFATGGGTIRIELKRQGSRAECRVTDNGSGPENIRQNIRQNIRHGQGLGIIRDLAGGLDGKFEQRFGAGGAVAVVSFPIRDV